MRNLNIKLKQLKKSLDEKLFLDNKLGRLDNDIFWLEQRKQRLALELKMSGIDFKYYEGKNVAEFVNAEMNGAPQAADGGKRRLFVLKLKYDESCRSLELIRQEIQEVRTQLTPYILFNNDYSEYLSERTKYLKEKCPGLPDTLLKYSDEHSQLLEKGILMAESMQTATALIDSLDGITENISSASEWNECIRQYNAEGLRNRKLSSLDTAIFSISRTQSLLIRLLRGISCLDEIIDTSEDRDFFTGYSDFIYENLFVDWTQESAQKKVRSENRSIKHKLSGLIELIKDEFETIGSKLSFLESKIKTYRLDSFNNPN
ncbi:MAG: hypothetical protein PHV32_12250 [Eubacteriales bacterium]|nr:hypothetical protein [Eubacteriales bacterium]